MFYSIKEGKENNILGYNITVCDFEYLALGRYEEFILDMINNSQIIRTFTFPDYIIDLIKDIIINDKDIEYLKEELTRVSVPLYSLIIGLVNTHKNKYNKLLEMMESDYIEIECNKDNFINGLELAKRLNKRTVIDGKSISLSDYQKILSNYNVESLDGYDIKIGYQMQNHDIDVKTLYDTAVMASDISRSIDKYNLSPFEKIIYVYDEVKKREYKKSNKDVCESRDLDRILQSDAIVCVGYSNLFNAILKNLGIKAIPLISASANHQRSLVYIEDSKYNIYGVYVFDPTADSKRSDKYINNYRYFGIKLCDSEKECPSDIYEYICLSFDDLANLFTSDDFTASVNAMDYLKYLFDFINFDYSEFNDGLMYYEFLEEKEKINVLEIYRRFLSNYNPKEIHADAFMMALYNTRLIQFYEGKINDFDIEDVKETSKNRSINQVFKYSNKEDLIERMFESIKYNDYINNILGKLVHHNSYDMEKNKLYIRLLKVLKSSKKDK